MRHVFSIAAGIIFLAGCTNYPPSTSPSTATSQGASSSSRVAGRWTGDAVIVVNWVRQKQLPVQIDVAADGTVSGTVGDATLTDAQLSPGRDPIQRSLGWGRDFRIHGKLQGNIIQAEQVQRDSVDIVFDQPDDATLRGGLATSGWEVGDAKSMKLTAGNLVLHRPN